MNESHVQRSRSTSSYNFELMVPVQIEIDLIVSFTNTELTNQINDHMYERELKPRQYRKKAQTNLQQYLKNQVPGRQSEIQQITKYIENLRLGDKIPLCLHGSTGCGKTSIMTKTLAYLKEYDKQFETLYINCLQFTNIKKIYSTILQQLFNITDRKQEQTLSYIFTNSHRQTEKIKLVIFDEMDQCVANTSFIYNILEWIQISAFSFGAVLISNMVNFIENLQNKSKSRIKCNSIIFAPYNFSQLVEIATYKFGHQLHLFEENAISFICQRVAQINSDVRLLEKYFEICIRLGKRNNVKIRIQDVKNWTIRQENKIQELLRPYQFILEVLWKRPREKDIAYDIAQSCVFHKGRQFRDNEIVFILTELQMMKILKLSKGNKRSNLCYKSWGIDLEEHAAKIYFNSQLQSPSATT